MSNIFVRDLDGRVISKLKAIAKRHGRSLQGEIKTILTEAVSFLSSEAVSVSARWRKSLTNRKLSDSSSLIREDRNR